MGRVSMGKLGLWVVVVIGLLIQLVRGFNGCIEEERVALLQLKDFLIPNCSIPSADGDPLLPTWVEHPESIDCCRWERVGCDRITGHVTKLSLDNVRRIPENEWLGICSLNGSVFVPFKELRSLNLSSNSFGSRINDEDLKSMSNFNKLRHLDLSWNYFDKNALRILGVLPSLQFFSLSSNYMEETISNQDLTYNQSNLEVLLLDGNWLNGSLPMEGLTSFRYLETLDLSYNKFSGSIPPSIGALSSLKFLSLAYNPLNGSLPIQGFCELEKLEELDLSFNYFEGILPPCSCNLRSIRFLDLSSNQFTGNISSSLLGGLNSLQYINLSHNPFEGLFSFSIFANHSKLEVVEFMSIDGRVEIETEYTDWVPMFQLKVLVLSNCNLNKQSGEIPKFLLHQHQLRVLDLSHNNLKGSFPNWLLVNNIELHYLSLRSNSFFGLFHLLSYCYFNTSLIDVSDNHLSGQLQVEMGEMLPHIKYVNLSWNAFEGGIPSSIGKMQELESLDLSSNHLSGEVPNQLVRNCMSLKSLLLSNNNFHGQIFSAVWIKWATIERLELNNNQFEGPLTNVVYSLPRLVFLDISNNYLSGKIPNSMDNMTNLVVLILRNNSFEGQFPCALPRSFMDISYNSFTGSFASCSNQNFLSLYYMHLQRNKFGALILQDLTNLPGVSRLDIEHPVLSTLDIRENNMSGIIPDSINALPNLKVLLLGGNQLGGSIPTQLCQLNEIDLMDLSNNFFTGSIPLCFNNITFGGDEDGYPQAHTVEISGMVAIVLPKVGYRGSLVYKDFNDYIRRVSYVKPDDVEFVTKYRTNTYQGSIVGFMSGLDLSRNQLTGEIPSEFGMFSSLRAVNLSHNHLTGSIPKTFSNLTQLESLDLSYNSLGGNIRPELIDLNFLAVFTVAYNNLSGTIPYGKAQFGTFDASSYEGNPFLRGPPLEKNFTTIVDLPTSTSGTTDEEGKWYDVDPLVFYTSFASTFCIFLLGFFTVLYINPYWRRRWFYLIEEGLYSSYYFLSDTLYKLLGFLRK